MMRLLSILSFILIIALSCKSPNESQAQSNHQYTNKLIDQSSPYLLQHAHNPVDWHPWGDEALQKAKDENKMLIISIGYAACHWCHVMEHESFEDTTVARVMNENFVCIKVDKEERPDIDGVYQTACRLATGKACGWPLNAFALANGQPVWANTYFPKKEWINVLEYFIKVKEEEPEKLAAYAKQITEGIQQNDAISFRDGDQQFTKEILNKIGDNFIDNIDLSSGGRKGVDLKFPMPNSFEFLLNYYHYSKNPMALEAAEISMDAMANGGIYDQLGGGFSRYSTDPQWHVPHFEKMLYDNSQLVSLYSKAYQLSKKPLYKKVVEETLQFIDREMTDKSGGFYSSLDADSEGEEGKFYVWTYEEVQSILKDEKDFEAFAKYYDLKKGGNWEHEKNVFQVKNTLAVVAKKTNQTEEELSNRLAKAREQLLAERSKRVRPGLDDKILTSWNAMMLEGYVNAYRAFADEKYLAKALKNAAFLSKNMLQKDFRLNRNYKDGKSVINAFLDDYALLANAFISLYQVTFDQQWLDKAKGLVDYTIQNFYDEQDKMFHYTSLLDPPLIARKKELVDNAVPGSNSSIARVLHRLGLYFYEPSYLEKARQMMFNIEEQIVYQSQPNFYSNWCQLYLDLVRPPYEVAIVGDQYKMQLKSMISNFTPHAILLGGKDEGNLDLLKNKLQEGETLIYVCQDKICKFPTSEVEKALQLME